LLVKVINNWWAISLQSLITRLIKRGKQASVSGALRGEILFLLQPIEGIMRQ
jgi:hypothetical protein